MRLRWLKRGKRCTVITLSHSKQPFGCSFLRHAGAKALRGVCAIVNCCRSMFLICSYVVLSSLHEPSILSCPQAPAGRGALQPAGATPFPELAVAIESKRQRGRGAQSNASGRFEAEARVAFDDGWQSLDDLPPFKTTVSLDTSRKVITRNDSPDIGFDRSINPYRGCEHGCVYCFARPTHAYLGTVARARFRIQAADQARRAGTAGEGTGRAPVTSRA